MSLQDSSNQDSSKGSTDKQLSDGFNLTDTALSAAGEVLMQTGGEDNRTQEADSNPGHQDEAVDYKAKYEAEAAERAASDQRYKALQGKYNAEVPALSKKVKELQEAAPAGQPGGDGTGHKANTSTSTDTGSDDDALPPEVEALREDAPTVYAAVEKLVEHRTRKSEKAMAKRVEPFVKKSEEAAIAEHFGQIKTAHANFNDVVTSDQFNGWIQKLPSYQRGAAQAVLESGTAPEVIELLTDYKKTSGLSANSGSDSNVDDDDDAVVSRRTGAKPGAGGKGAVDQNDFGGGFNMD